MTRRRWRRRWAPSCLGVWGGLQSTTSLLPRKAAEDLAFGQAKLQQIGQKRVDLFQNCLFDTFSPSSSFYSVICCNFFVTRPRLRKVLGQPLWVQILFPLQNLTMPLPLETRPPPGVSKQWYGSDSERFLPCYSLHSKSVMEWGSDGDLTVPGLHSGFEILGKDSHGPGKLHQTRVAGGYN